MYASSVVFDSRYNLQFAECWCGNPRKWFKQRTLAELVSDDCSRDQKAEMR